MITILAEKPDVGNKIAAALDRITLDSGREVTFASLKANERAVKAQQTIISRWTSPVRTIPAALPMRSCAARCCL